MKIGQRVAFYVFGNNGIELKEGRIIDIYYDLKRNENIFEIQTEYGNFVRLAYDEIQYEEVLD